MYRILGVIFISCLNCAQPQNEPRSNRDTYTDEAEGSQDRDNVNTGRNDDLQPVVAEPGIDRSATKTCQENSRLKDGKCILRSFRELCGIQLSREYQRTIDIMIQLLNKTSCSGVASYVENVEELYLSGPKTGASGIGQMNRAEMQIVELGPIGTLTHLKILDLQSHLIQDWRPLASLQDLEELYLEFNEIRNLTDMVIPSLTKLGLRGNQIQDATPLRRFIGLGAGVPEGKGLDLRDNPLGNSIEKTRENCPRGKETPAPLKLFCLTD